MKKANEDMFMNHKTVYRAANTELLKELKIKPHTYKEMTTFFFFKHLHEYVTETVEKNIGSRL